MAYSCVHAAQKLDLYQLLARNAYSPQETFVPILGKTVSATVHEVMNMSCCIYESTLSPICSPVQQSLSTNSNCVCLQRVMVQFVWHDGTVKNLHVDLPSLQKYQVYF